MAKLEIPERKSFWNTTETEKEIWAKMSEAEKANYRTLDNKELGKFWKNARKKWLDDTFAKMQEDKKNGVPQKINPKGCLVLLVMLVFVISMGVLVFTAIKTFGPKPDPSLTAAVFNNELDGSVKQVKAYVKENAIDPGSVQFIEWSTVIKQGEKFAVRAKFKSKNSLGLYVITNAWFYMDPQGFVLSMKEIE